MIEQEELDEVRALWRAFVRKVGDLDKNGYNVYVRNVDYDGDPSDFPFHIANCSISWTRLEIEKAEKYFIV